MNAPAKVIIPHASLKPLDRPKQRIAYNTALNLEHFSDPAFMASMREIFHHLALNYADYPSGNEVAKVWEVVQAVRGLRDFGALTRSSDVLGVAAGHEHTVFYLTNYVARVFATDLYFGNEDWNEAKTAMLVSPENFAIPGMVWNPKRLVVQHMDALNLRSTTARSTASSPAGRWSISARFRTSRAQCRRWRGC